MRASHPRWILLTGLLFFLAHGAFGQNIPAAKRTLIINAFGGYQHLDPDYGQYTDHGFMLGVDVGRPFHHIMTSVEFRITHGVGDGVGETGYMGGLKVEKSFRRFTPYGDFLIGYGVFTFTHPTSAYSQDNSVIYDFGGGADFYLGHNFSVKGDFQIQRWQLGNANNPLEPIATTVGVSYRLPSRPLWGRK